MAVLGGRRSAKSARGVDRVFSLSSFMPNTDAVVFAPCSEQILHAARPVCRSFLFFLPTTVYRDRVDHSCQRQSRQNDLQPCLSPPGCPMLSASIILADRGRIGVSFLVWLAAAIKSKQHVFDMSAAKRAPSPPHPPRAGVLVLVRVRPRPNQHSCLFLLAAIKA